MFFKSILGGLALVMLTGLGNGPARAESGDSTPTSSTLTIRPALLTSSGEQASTPVTEVQWRRGYRSNYRPYSRGWNYGYPYRYGYSQPYYRSYYRPYYGGYYSSYRPYYRGYYAPYYTGYRGFGYSAPRIGASFYW